MLSRIVFAVLLLSAFGRSVSRASHARHCCSRQARAFALELV